MPLGNGWISFCLETLDMSATEAQNVYYLLGTLNLLQTNGFNTLVLCCKYIRERQATREKSNSSAF